MSPLSTNQPFSGSVTISGMPPTRVASTGVPLAMASINTSPNGSSREFNTRRSAACSAGDTSCKLAGEMNAILDPRCFDCGKQCVQILFFVPKDHFAHDRKVHVRRLRTDLPQSIDQFEKTLSGADLSDCADQEVLVGETNAFSKSDLPGCLTGNLLQVHAVVNRAHLLSRSEDGRASALAVAFDTAITRVPRASQTNMRIAVLTGCRGNVSWTCQITGLPVPIAASDATIPARTELAWMKSGATSANLFSDHPGDRFEQRAPLHEVRGLAATRTVRRSAAVGSHSTPQVAASRPPTLLPSGRSHTAHNALGRARAEYSIRTFSAPLTSPV